MSLCPDPVADQPVLLFDSGVGGLSVLSAVRAHLPEAPLVYVADSAGFPYGGRTEAEIAARVPALLGRLAERHHPRLIVIACNTASTIALDAVRGALDVPIVGTVPAIKPAAALSRTRVIGVLGTEATVRQPYVDRLAREFAGDCTVIRHGSPELVRLAEGKLSGIAPPPGEMVDAIAGLMAHPDAARLDVVVLACTHFPLLGDELAAAFAAYGQAAHGQTVRFVDGAEGIARRVAHLTAGQPWPRAGEAAPGLAVFTRLDERTRSLAPALSAFGLVEVTEL